MTLLRMENREFIIRNAFWTSEELIKLSGGIVQGMSVAQLVHNDKLIGAVNCVNTNDSLDGYAIFIDKLL